MYSCPLAMTGKKIIGVMLYENLPFFFFQDGAARVIELLGTKEMKEDIYTRLIRYFVSLI